MTQHLHNNSVNIINNNISSDDSMVKVVLRSRKIRFRLMYPWIVSVLMLLVAFTTFLQRPITRLSSLSSSSIRSSILASAASTGSASRLQACTHSTTDGAITTTCTDQKQQQNSNNNNNNEIMKIYRTVQVQIVHRHGDRTPITPLRNEEVWQKELVSSSSLERISSLTTILRDDTFVHKARGKGPFGKLTQLGFDQMVDLGRRLRNDLVASSQRQQQQHVIIDKHGHGWNSHVIHDGDLHPHHVQIYSTDFERTLQSVQGVLIGMFPHLLQHEQQQQQHGQSRHTNTSFTIDARHTPFMIPDPQPRATEEQVRLEQKLADQPHWVQLEESMRPLAVRLTQALQDLLAEGAMDVTFGVAEAASSSNSSTSISDSSDATRTLSWAQLAEITKCLRVRNMLPPSITPEDQEIVSTHLAQRWFGLLRHPRLSYLAMNRMAGMMLQRMVQRQQQQQLLQQHNPSSTPPIIIYSAHDSTLIALMCAFRLEQPSQWPEYGSYLKLELIEEEIPTTANDSKHSSVKNYWVRFSLNSEPLQSQWNDHTEDGAKPFHPHDDKYLIPLHVLDHNMAHIGSRPNSVSTV